MSTFDASTFMTSTIDEPLDTVIAQCAAGEFPAMIDSIDENSFKTIETKNGQRTIFNVPWVIQDEAVKAELGREKVVVPQQIWLDLDDAGQLDTGKGKNVDLGRLREALGQNNTSGWNFAMLSGAGPALVRVEHEQDRNKSDVYYARVKRVAKIS